MEPTKNILKKDYNYLYKKRKQDEVRFTKHNMDVSKEVLNNENKSLAESKEPLLSIQNISSISQELAATEGLSASMEIISNNTDKLAEVIEVLNELVNRFNV